MPVVDIGTGASIAFGSTSWSATLLAINGTGISRGSVPTSHLGTTTAQTFMRTDLYDGGELQLELLMDADNVNSNKPPIFTTHTSETVTITFPVPSGMSNGATAAFSAFMTGFEYGVPLEDRMTASATLKISGAITWADAT